MLLKYFVVFLLLAVSHWPLAAQQTVPNPLRAPEVRNAPAVNPDTSEPRRRAARPRTEPERPPGSTAEAETPKPKRERSARQRENDDDMRACGASWRTGKAELAAKGETWRSYLKTCRTARKTARDRV